MASINGVVVPGTLVPTDTGDTYPVTDNHYAIDGHRSVANLAAMYAIPAPRRRQGMTVACQADEGDGPNVLWQLNPPPWKFDATDWKYLVTDGTEEAPTDGQVYGRSNAGWVPVTASPPSPPGTVVSAASYNTQQWTWTTGTDASGSGQVGLGTAAKGQKKGPTQWAAATVLNINKLTSDGTDMTMAFSWVFVPGNEVYIQKKVDSTCFGRYKITGPAVDMGTYYQIPISQISSNLLPPAAATPMTVTAVQFADGAPPSPPGTGTGTPGGTNGQIQYNENGEFGGFDMSGDATLDTTTGIITVDKTNGIPFGSMAEQNADDVHITGGIITGLPTPVDDSDAAPKGYVDAAAQGLTVKTPVDVASAGVDVPLSGGSTLMVDGLDISNGSRLLLKDQADPSQNGIYDVSGIGTNYTLTRSADAATAADLPTGSYVLVNVGVENSGSSYVLTTKPPITIDTTPLTWTKFTEAPVAKPGGAPGQLQYNAGDSFGGLTMSGDATLATDGTITVDKTNGIPFGTLSVQDSDAVDITGGTITGLPDPTDDTDAATKGYVDSHVPTGGGIPEAPTDGQLYGRANSEWVVIPAGGAIYTEEWNWTTKTTDASNAGQVGDNSTAAGRDTATLLNINVQAANNRDLTYALDNLWVPGCEVIIQQKTDSTRYTKYTITGPAVNQGNWRQFPVTVTDFSGTKPNNSATVEVALQTKASGGAANITEGFGIDITNNQVSIDSNYPGQASITTVGNVTTGTISGGTWT